MKKGLMALLVAWVMLVVIACMGYMMHLGRQIDGKGPRALAGDGEGGFFLVAGNEILHFNADEKLRGRHALGTLGLKSANSLLQADHALLVYDNERHRIFRCDTGNWSCAAFSPASLPFSNFVAMAWLDSGELLVSDNDNHRLVTLGADGKPVFVGASAWHFPNQVTATENGFLLADTNRFSILHLSDVHGASPKIMLQTQSRPYQFVQRHGEWWVLQAGLKLESGALYRYRDGVAEKTGTGAEDPAALLDTGSRLVIASRQDWQLLSVNPDSGNAIPVADAAYQRELTQQRLRMQSARQARSRVPYVMLALMLPALLGGVLLQRRMDAEKSDSTSAPSLFPSDAPLKPALAANLRIDTDKSAVEMQRTQQNRALLRAGLILLPLLLLLAGMLWLGTSKIPGLFGKAGIPLLGLLVVFFIVIPLLVYLGRRRQDRLFNQHFICGPQKLVHVQNGKPVNATPYAAIMLGDETLLLNGKAHPLYIGHGKFRFPLWTVHDIQREIGSRIPASQHFASDITMGLALLRSRPLLGLRLVLARFMVVAVILLVLALKLFSTLEHLHIFTLWKIFKPA